MTYSFAAKHHVGSFILSGNRRDKFTGTTSHQNDGGVGLKGLSKIYQKQFEKTKKLKDRLLHTPKLSCRLALQQYWINSFHKIMTQLSKLPIIV